MSCIGLGSSQPILNCHHVCMDLAALASADRLRTKSRKVFLVDAVEHMPTASLNIHKVLDIDTLSCLIWNWCLWTMTFRFERNNRSRSQLPSDDYTSVASPWLCMSWSAIGVLEMVRWSLARQEEFMEAVEQELVSWNLMKQHLIGFIKT